ncbi:uncharacterized protein [Ptychodera flava]|uniref:uncharacterized protein n=1 Tax=Ptychodera flava TaxID=63121 RepID=UPI00396A05C6
MCPPSEKPLATEKCQDYSDCNVWQSLQLLRQDQIYSERSLIHRQINLTLPSVQAEADFIGAKHDIAEKELGFNLQRIRANLSVPEQVAKAELLEAKARQSLAKNTIEVPADGKTSFPNIGYLGRGYDIFYGNPRNDDGSVDPGFRQAVIGLTYNKVRLSSDRLFLMPDQADVIREMGSHFSSRTTIITSERSYRNSLDFDVSVGASVGIDIFSGGFSASTSYHTMTQSTVNMENVYVDVTGRVIVYDARLTPFNTDISNEFRDAVRNLPAIACCTYSVRCHADCGFYDDFIAGFGTHYATRVLMGGKATQRYQMTGEAMEKMQDNEFGFSFSVSAGVEGIASFSSGMSSKIANSMRQSLSQSDQSSVEFFLGGEAGVGQISEGNSDSMKEWASTVFDNPVPIQYTLGAVVDLLTQENFPNDKKIETKQSVLRARYQGYCNRIPDARCSDFSKRTRDANGNSVHFGDIVHITMNSCEGKMYFLKDSNEGIHAVASDFKESSTTTKASIMALPNQLCTWVQQVSSGPNNPFGKDWVKFMKHVHSEISSKCVYYEGLSKDECEDYCKQMDGCQAGTYTASDNGFCMLFTSYEREENKAYYEKTVFRFLFFKFTKRTAHDYTYHWSCYTDRDREYFGNVWDELQLKSFRPHFRVINSEQSKLFTIISPVAIMNVEREELHYGDPFSLVAASGIVTREEGTNEYQAKNPEEKSGLLRFRVVNDHKPNGMPVKLGDIVRFQEANRFQETLLMQNLPYYLTIPAGGSQKSCSGIWPFQVCTKEQKLLVRNELLGDCEHNTFTWNISRAEVKSMIPEFDVPTLSGLDRVEYRVQEDRMGVEADVFLTRPVRRKNAIPGTVVDEVSSVTLLPGYDGHNIISSDFQVELKRGNSTIMNPSRQRFLFQGRDLTEYRLGIYFQDTLKDGDILTLKLSDQIVSEEEDALGGQKISRYHVYMEPTYTANVSDATSLLTGEDAGKETITVRVTFDKPVVNAEREVPDIYDFEIADMRNETMTDVILRVARVNGRRDCENLTQCSKEFDVIIKADFLKGQTHFYFDVTSGRLKSAKDYLFVREKQIRLDLH